jgi:predicted Rossmann fold flavoprotein
MKIAIIGGGAAGFFSAITAKENFPSAEVTIFEKSRKLLSKVEISGGGRCNVTNACETIDELCSAYPRGGRSLKKAFYIFSNKDTIKWFESRGVPLMIQDDNRVFPQSQRSQTIVDCFLFEAKRLGIEIELGLEINTIEQIDDFWLISINKETKPRVFDKVIVATGGSPQISCLKWLETLGHKIENPVPSLFTFKMPTESITQLPGISVEHTIVSIQGTKLKAEGPLLITHFGMSGPAILKLSSFEARVLSEMNYKFKIQVNWANESNNDLVAEQLRSIAEEHTGKLLSNYRPYALSSRLWLYLLEKCEFAETKLWVELGKKGLNKLTNILTNDEYTVNGRTTFKEEFVTCGGVSLQSVDMNTMQSKVCKNLYFTGEVLDIDGITGGYNFQAAWTTGFIAGKSG